MGVLLTVIAALVATEHAGDAAEREQRSELHLAADATRNAANGVISDLEALATLYAAARPVSPAHLRLAAAKLLQNPIVAAVSVLRAVPQSGRARFEASAGPIVELDGRTRARTRPQYTPILTALAQQGIGVGRPSSIPARGHIDAAADPRRALALARAIRTRSASVTAPNALLDPGRAVVAFYLPVVRLTGELSPLRVAVVCDTRVLARTIAAALPSGLGAQIRDGSVSFEGGRAAVGPSTREAVVRVAGRAWTVSVDRVPAAWSGIAATAGSGLSLTLLAVLGVGALVRREQEARTLAVLGARERDLAARDALDARRRSLFLEQSATDILLLTRPDGTLTYVSPAAQALLGTAPDALLGHTLAALAHPDDRDRLEALVAHLGRTDAAVDITHRLRRADGRWLWVETLLRAVKDPATGAVMEAQGSVRDVTRRRDAERRLREAELRFRSAFDEAPLGMAVISLEGELLQANRALAGLCAWDEPGPRGVAFDALLHQADADVHAQARDALLDGVLREHTAELRLVQPGGEVVWTAMSTALVLAADGSPRHYLTQVQDVSGRRRAEAQLQYLVDRDPLTGLLNRRAFERSLDEHLRRGRRYGVRGAVLVIDLDGFAAVGARLGRTATDALLARIADALRGRLRDSDLIARHGGDEFVVLLPEAELPEALEIAAGLADVVRTADAHVPLTASIGLALVDRPEQRGDELLSDADLAMYDAKQAGRDRLRQARGARARPAQRGRARAAGADPAAVIRAALSSGRLVLHAEPLLDLAGGGVPELVLHPRLVTPDGDLHGPAAFLPDAERAGLVPELDRYVITRAAELLADYPDGPALSARVSVRSLMGDGLVDVLSDQLTRRNVDPRRLTVTLREHEAVAHLARVQEFGRDLGHLGCPLALDDVGAGFGSFYFLKHLPFDVLRIDEGFVRSSATEHIDQVVIAAIVELAAGVGARTVATGAADAPTLEALRALGVDQAQGPAVGAPVPAREALDAAGRPQA
ncbi:EAL domain-containing protein [Paraconexibacter sp. AEG42_29]|uniref:EAL domain-containing protein n=1 Tax=Paraconexibacter sp. AEG42_29 TaxID=2997339 RepID=UPI00339DA416